MRFLFFFFFLISAGLKAQDIDSLNYGPEPRGGISKLAIHYFKINFTKDQRQRLAQQEIEFIYSIDERGKPVLEKVNGVTDAAILDSLQWATNRIPWFQPQIVEGKPVPSVYFFSLLFPVYGQRQPIVMDRYKPIDIDDFDYLEVSKSLEVLMGGLVNTFAGSANEYLGTGGGMKVDMIYVGERNFGMGLDMSFYGNTLKKDYPINSMRDQNSAPPTLLIGLAFQWSVLKLERRQLSVQVEANYAIQNITPRLDSYDTGWTQFKGFSPGVLANYMVKLGKDRVSSYYGDLAILNHWLNIHAGVRQLFYNNRAANGIMLEVGISYRMKTSFIKSYRLKPE